MSKKYFKETAALEARNLRLKAIGDKIVVVDSEDRGHDSEVDEIMEKYEEHQATNGRAALGRVPMTKRKKMCDSSTDDDAPPKDVRSLAAGTVALASPRRKKPR